MIRMHGQKLASCQPTKAQVRSDNHSLIRFVLIVFPSHYHFAKNNIFRIVLLSNSLISIPLTHFANKVLQANVNMLLSDHCPLKRVLLF